jgi:hypothetical protein
LQKQASIINVNALQQTRLSNARHADTLITRHRRVQVVCEVQKTKANTSFNPA